MPFNRRTFLRGAGSLAAASMASRPTLSLAQTPLGSMTITSVSDGTMTLPKSMLFDTLSPDQVDPILLNYGITGEALSPPCNVTLLQTGERLVLFDVGAGPDFMATTGQLSESLDAIGIDPTAITDVVFTHAHPDHIWGLMDDFGDLVFSEARYSISQAEWDYWTDPNTVGTIGETRTTFAIGAERRLREIADQINFFKDGAEILPGVAARATFGHTPGHMAFEIRSGSESAMVIGDAIGNHHVAFERPDWYSGSDQDQAQAAATRVSLMDQLASEQMRIVGFHLLGNGVGHVERKDSGYRFVPDSA